MKKITVITIIFAALAITACTKKENTISNNNLSGNETVSPKEPYYGPTSACFYWRHVNHPEENCVNFSVLGELCYITVGCESEHSLSIRYGIDTVNLRITSLDIPISSIPQDIENWLSQQVLTKTITFNYDCPIDDSNILNLCSVDYIPAGTYTLTSNNEYYKISLN